MSFIRTLPIGYVTEAATPTTGDDFAIPLTGIRPKIVRVNTSAAGFVGFGTDDSPPAASTSNCVYHASGQTDYILDDQLPYTHVYVYSATSTIVVYVSFLG
jgi:hypothetical protein